MPGFDYSKPFHWLSFGGVRSMDYGVTVDASDSLVKPAKEVEHIAIPGRSGDLLIDNDRWSNVPITYHCFIRNGFDENFNAFLAALHSKKGYQILEDYRMCEEYAGTYNGVNVPGVYRRAVLEDVVSAKNVFLENFGEFDLVFNCMPQKWLYAGQIPITVNSSNNNLLIKNPTSYISSPLIQCYGKGNASYDAPFTIYGDGSTTETSTINVNKNSPYSYIYVDCDILEAYYDGQLNANPYISISNASGKFPKCGSASGGFRAYINTSRGATSMNITPRWWTI